MSDTAYFALACIGALVVGALATLGLGLILGQGLRAITQWAADRKAERLAQK